MLNANLPLIESRAQLLGSLLLFTQVFYKLTTGRDFVIAEPIGRESHNITVCKTLTKVFRGEIKRLVLNIPPGFGKSTHMVYFIAWTLAHYPDSQYLYISYSKELATKNTYNIRQIVELPEYKALFGVSIKTDSSAKDNFKTEQGGSVMAFGSSGSITGQDGGLPNLERFSGGVFMDDMHKNDEVHSDKTREGVKTNFLETISIRPRSPSVPLVFLGQRLHEDDLPGNLLRGFDGHHWDSVILKGLDEAGNALNPAVKTKEDLLIMQEKSPYAFASQYQQDPQPAGGGIFRVNWFPLLDEEPEFLATFITGDTAETDKTYNDATVFSFWGLYRIEEVNVETDVFALHWIDCIETRVEPKDLEYVFRQFYASCMRHAVKPKIAAIEKKSTGATLLSVLGSFRGIQILDIERTQASGNKTTRFLSVQPYIASKQVSLPRYGKHTGMCLDHCKKITANNTHRFDDIADTMSDAIQIALVDQMISRSQVRLTTSNNQILKSLISQSANRKQLWEKSQWKA